MLLYSVILETYCLFFPLCCFNLQLLCFQMIAVSIISRREESGTVLYWRVLVLIIYVLIWVTSARYRLSFFSEVWRMQWKLLLLICIRGYDLEKHLNVFLSILVSRAKLGRGRTEAREVSSAAVKQLPSSALFILVTPWWEGEATGKTQFSLFHFTNEHVRSRETKSESHKAMDAYSCWDLWELDTYKHFRVSRFSELLRLLWKPGTEQGSHLVLLGCFQS